MTSKSTWPLGPGRWAYTDEQIPGFIVSAHIQQFDGTWIITDLAIAVAPPQWEKRIPAEKDGPFVSSVLPKPDKLSRPFAGITSGTLTSLKLEELRRWVGETVDARPKDTAEQTELDADLVAAFESGKRVGRTPVFYARIAALYVDECQNTNKVYDAMSKRVPLAASTIRDAVKEARKQGLLTRAPGQGRRGGELTEQAIVLLSRDARH